MPFCLVREMSRVKKTIRGIVFSARFEGLSRKPSRLDPPKRAKAKSFIQALKTKNKRHNRSYAFWVVHHYERKLNRKVLACALLFA